MGDQGDDRLCVVSVLELGEKRRSKGEKRPPEQELLEQAPIWGGRADSFHGECISPTDKLKEKVHVAQSEEGRSRALTGKKHATWARIVGASSRKKTLLDVNDLTMEEVTGGLRNVEQRKKNATSAVDKEGRLLLTEEGNDLHA